MSPNNPSWVFTLFQRIPIEVSGKWVWLLGLIESHTLLLFWIVFIVLYIVSNILLPISGVGDLK